MWATGITEGCLIATIDSGSLKNMGVPQRAHADTQENNILDDNSP